MKPAVAVDVESTGGDNKGEKDELERTSAPSSLELCICLHSPYGALNELARRVKMEVIVEVSRGF